MYAIVESGGKQYRVTPGAQVVVDRLVAEVDEQIVLDQVLLIAGEDLKVGSPTVEGAKITARVVRHNKGPKVITFKYRPRKRYRRRVGFRASHTTLEILAIEA
ncbi:MAG: 50S ribosomal protein L21 [Deltaproteobacteria bacterium]|nr:50S ribosomal protein L21 [Deltaproteobacteria bacterium]